MRIAELERITRTWQKRLHLDHWTITIVHDLEGADLGEATCSDAYDEATIRYNKDYRDWTDAAANRTAVHELLHVFTRDRTASVEAAKLLLGADAYKLYIDRHYFEDEGVIERLSAVLVALVGLA